MEKSLRIVFKFVLSKVKVTVTEYRNLISDK